MGDEFGIVEDAVDADDELVFDDDDEFTWGMVARASGVEEPERNLRSNSSLPSSSKKKAIASSSSRPKKSLHLRDIEEEAEVDSQESEEECADEFEADNDEEDEDDEVFDEEEDDLI